jgi:hypothetical protein
VEKYIRNSNQFSCDKNYVYQCNYVCQCNYVYQRNLSDITWYWIALWIWQFLHGCQVICVQLIDEVFFVPCTPIVSLKAASHGATSCFSFRVKRTFYKDISLVAWFEESLRSGCSLLFEPRVFVFSLSYGCALAPSRHNCICSLFSGYTRHRTTFYLLYII